MKSRRRNQTALTSALRACYGSIAMWWNGIEARGQAIKPASTLCSALIWRNERTRKLTPSAPTFDIFVRLAGINSSNLRTLATSAGSTIRPSGFVNASASQGIFPTFPVAGRIRKHPRGRVRENTTQNTRSLFLSLGTPFLVFEAKR